MAPTPSSPGCASANGPRCRACTTRPMPSTPTTSTWSSTCATPDAPRCHAVGGHACNGRPAAGHARARELHEELGIQVQGAQPLVHVPWCYDQRELLLDAWRVLSWLGEPTSLEGQPLEWLAPTKIDPATLTPADRVILP